MFSSHLCHDVGALPQAGSTQAIVDLDRLLILLELQVGVGQEDLLAPVVREVQPSQLVSAGHEAAQLQPRPPVGGLLPDTLTEGGDGELWEMQLSQHHAIHKEAVTIQLP